MRPLFDQITRFSNLLAAFRKAACGKRRGAAVAGFEFDLEDNLFQLQTELRASSYRPGAYTHFYIHDPKRRLDFLIIFLWVSTPWRTV